MICALTWTENPSPKHWLVLLSFFRKGFQRGWTDLQLRATGCELASSGQPHEAYDWVGVTAGDSGSFHRIIKQCLVSADLPGSTLPSLDGPFHVSTPLRCRLRAREEQPVHWLPQHPAATHTQSRERLRWTNRSRWTAKVMATLEMQCLFRGVRLDVCRIDRSTSPPSVTVTRCSSNLIAPSGINKVVLYCIYPSHIWVDTHTCDVVSGTFSKRLVEANHTHTWWCDMSPLMSAERTDRYELDGTETNKPHLRPTCHRSLSWWGLRFPLRRRSFTYIFITMVQPYYHCTQTGGGRNASSWTKTSWALFA